MLASAGRRSVIGISGLLCALLAAPLQSAFARGSEPVGPAAPPPREKPSTVAASSGAEARGRLTRYTLPNGLRVGLEVDRSRAFVVTCVTYALGSRDDPDGKEGAAWVLQRLLASSDPKRSGALARLIAAGGSSRGEVGPDHTQYLTSAPASALALALRLEAERQAKLSLSPAELWQAQRDALLALEQKRAAAVEAFAEQRLLELAFQGYPPYSHPLMGTRSSLRALDAVALSELQERGMRPDRAALSVVGDFSEREARRLIEQYFGRAAPEKLAAVPAPLDLPRQTSERFNTNLDRRVDAPLAFYAWSVPSADTKTHDALRVLTELLSSSGDTAAGSPAAATEGRLAFVRAWMFPHQRPGALGVSLRVGPRSSVDDARGLLERELARYASDGPNADELSRAKASLAASLEAELGSSESRARSASLRELTRGDARLAFDEADRYRAVTRAEVRLATDQFLTETRRTSVEIYPPGWPQDPPTAIRREHVVKAGENLIQIAKRHGSSVDAIATANHIRSNRFIFPGQELIIPVPPADARRVKGRAYTVAAGDSLSMIAKRHGVSIDALALANRRRRDQRIMIGDRLTIPPPASRASNAAPRRAEEKGRRLHQVRRGDTLLRLAKRYGVSAAELARENGRLPTQPIKAGEKLAIPAPAPSTKGAKPR